MTRVSGIARRSLPWAFAIVVLALVAFASARPGQDGPITNPVDFRAFYCAGKAVLARADPYRVEPARTCQNQALAASRLRWNADVVDPTPQPPYALAFFAPFGALPFVAASALWFAVCVCAWARSVLLVRSLTGLRLVWVALAAFGLGLVASTTYGKIMPVTLWLFVETAAALRADDDRRAAVFATLATIEIHVGLPVWLALWIARPRMRRALTAGAAAFAVLSLVALGPDRCLEWMLHVVPAQASSELRDPEQFSLTSALVLAGIDGALARTLGALDYAAMTALGIVAAIALRARWRDDAVLALVPAAFAVLGGAYMHQNQLAAAIPIALLGYARTRRAEFLAALALLAFPWYTLLGGVPMIAGAPGALHALLAAVRPDDLTEAVWSRYASEYAPPPSWIATAVLLKMPSWLGVTLALAGVAREAMRSGGRGSLAFQGRA